MLRLLFNPLNLFLFFCYLLVRILILLPLPILMLFGFFVGYLNYLFAYKRRAVSLFNIKKCLPHLSEKKQKELAKKSMISMGQTLIEIMLALWGGRKRIKKLSRVSGVENLQKARTKNTGVLLLAAHFHMMELAGRMLAEELNEKLNVIYRAYKNKFIEHIIHSARQKNMNEGFTKNNIRGFIKSLKNGNAIIYLPDQNFSRDHIFVPFFDIEAATTPATSKISKLINGKVVPFFFHRVGILNPKYIIKLLPAVDNFPTDDVYVDTARINKILEDEIKKYPEQYLWAHRRFRTRPVGEKNFYPAKLNRKKRNLVNGIIK